MVGLAGCRTVGEPPAVWSAPDWTPRYEDVPVWKYAE